MTTCCDSIKIRTILIFMFISRIRSSWKLYKTIYNLFYAILIALHFSKNGAPWYKMEMVDRGDGAKWKSFRNNCFLIPKQCRTGISFCINFLKAIEKNPVQLIKDWIEIITVFLKQDSLETVIVIFYIGYIVVINNLCSYLN